MKLEFTKNNRDILQELYYGTYEPDSFKPNAHSRVLDKKVVEAELLLREHISEEARTYLESYQIAVTKRDSTVAELAFKDGFRLAVQLLWAGCAIENDAEGDGDDD